MHIYKYAALLMPTPAIEKFELHPSADVLIHLQRQELIVNPEHPNYAQLKMK